MSTAETLPLQLQCDPVDPLAGGEWDKLASRFSFASVFHGSAWARVLHRTYGHHPSYLRIHAGGSTVALAPLMEVRSRLTGTRGVSLPFSDFCGPLVHDESLRAELLPFITDLARERRWSHFDLRCENWHDAGLARWRTYSGHVLDLSKGMVQLERGLSELAARSIKKAARSGIAIEADGSLDSVRAFYQLHCLTRRRHGLPPQSFRFFAHLHEEIIGRGHGLVVLAKEGRRAIAGAVFLRFQDSAVFKFGASDVRRWPLRPNHAVMWEGIRMLAGQGCRTLHFGRTSSADRGLSRFKSSWGADITSINQFRFSPRDRGWKGGTDPAAENHRAIFGWLPLRFNRILGSLIYPHLD